MSNRHDPTDVDSDHQRLVEEYEANGYHHVHIRHDLPGLTYAPHYHPDHVVLQVIKGELDVELDGQHTVLTAGKKIEIHAEQFHATVVGTAGCTYLHAEKRVTS